MDELARLVDKISTADKAKMCAMLSEGESIGATLNECSGKFKKKMKRLPSSTKEVIDIFAKGTIVFRDVAKVCAMMKKKMRC